MAGRIVHPNATEAVATSYSGGYEPFGDNIGVSVAVTDTGTSGTLTVSVEWSPDGVNFGAADSAADAFTTIATVIALSKSFAVKAPYYRLKYVVAVDAVIFTAAVFG